MHMQGIVVGMVTIFDVAGKVSKTAFAAKCRFAGSWREGDCDRKMKSLSRQGSVKHWSWENRGCGFARQSQESSLEIHGNLNQWREAGSIRVYRPVQTPPVSGRMHSHVRGQTYLCS